MISFEIFGIIAMIYLFTFIFGKGLEKIKVPWIFGALIFGFLCSIFGLFEDVFSTHEFSFLAELGMYFMLFMIGFEIDVKELVSQSRFYVKATFFITLLAAICGGLTLFWIFSLPLFIAFFIGLSFATVGEAVLVPILEELKVVRTKLGRAIIAIGILDDVFELFTLVILSLLPSLIPGFRELSSVGVEKTLFALFCVFTLAYLLTRLAEKGKKFKVSKIETLFTVIFFVLFSFVAIGKLPGDAGDLAPLGALFAGIAVKNFIPKRRLEFVESEIRAIAYALFAPVFFAEVGIMTNFSYLFAYPHYVLAIVLATGIPKIAGSYVIARKELGKRDSLLLGIALCTRFSTSIVIVRYLLSTGIISRAIYSTLIASTAVFTLSIPFAFSYLLNRSFHKSDFVREIAEK